MAHVPAFAAFSESTPLKPHTINRRAPSPDDVAIDIDYCGVCHSDIHVARNEWGRSTLYPLVPGHEIIGRVAAIGSRVIGFQVGDLVGVGCMVDSCQRCSACDTGDEQYCENGMVLTYGSEYKKHNVASTQGGYSKHIVVDQQFVVRVPDNIDTKAAAPLLCAGVTMWSPMQYWKMGKGHRIGIIGLGGLGHMGVKLAKALGAEVVMITTSEEKGKDAVTLGADSVLLSKDAQAMEAEANSFDFLLNTIPVSHDMNPYVSLLAYDGTMVLVGALEPLHPGLDGMTLILGRKSIAGSVIGGIKETQDMLDFCGKHNIVAEVEMIDIQSINEAYERMIKGDIKYRFVIDMNSLNA